MAIRKIYMETDGNLLHKKSREVTVFDDKLGTLLDDMRETMHLAEGVGLAAPQVGLLKRCAVVEVPDSGFYLEMVNPVIESSEGEVKEKEGCLSVSPEKNCEVVRPQRIVLRAQDRHGTPFECAVEGYAARAVCHEIDHLNGILFYSKK